MTLDSSHAKPFVCFVHVEKAGGMTMHQILHHSVPGYISPHPGFGEHFDVNMLSKLSKFWPRKINGIGGHRMGAFLNYEQQVSAPIFYMTFLRDPIRRYMSSINWKKYIMGQDWNIDSYGKATHYYNFQCYRIAGERSFEKAKEILLNKFSFVGLMEEFDRSLLLLQHLLPVYNLDTRYVRENVKDYGEVQIKWDDLSSKQQNQYRSNNEEDIRLYDFVSQELWPKYLKEYPSDLKEKEKEQKELLSQYTVKKNVVLKQKVSNYLLGRVWQPLLFGKDLAPK
mgnify:CR=1 FL=1